MIGGMLTLYSMACRKIYQMHRSACARLDVPYSECTPGCTPEDPRCCSFDLEDHVERSSTVLKEHGSDFYFVTSNVVFLFEKSDP